MLLEYNVPFKESYELEGDCIIEGIAINETITSNGHNFIGEELSKSASTMIGVPLLKDHDNSVDSIVGRVRKAHFDETLKAVPFKAVVKDSKMKQMIKDGLINSVSVGAHVNPEDIEENEDGTITPHNIIFKELSLVACPADDGATFSVALNNAWKKLSKKDSKKIENSGSERGLNMTEEETKNSETEEVKEEESKEAPAEEKSEAPAQEVISEEKLKSIVSEATKAAALAAVKAMKEADVDEEKPAEEAPAEEAPAEEASEDEDESEDESEEDESVEEGYKLVQGRSSFTLLKNNYRQRLVK